MLPKDLLVHLEKGDRRLEMLRSFDDPTSPSQLGSGLSLLGQAFSSNQMNDLRNEMLNQRFSQFTNSGVGQWFNR